MRALAKGTVLHADEAGLWDNLHERFEVKRINHQEASSQDGACTNWAEAFFSRLRRAEIGIHHPIAATHLLRYVQESLWRGEHRLRPTYHWEIRPNKPGNHILASGTMIPVSTL